MDSMDDKNENVAFLQWWTFRYWEVRAHDVRGIGSRPVEDMHWVIPLLTFDLKNPNQLTTYNLQACFNPTSRRLRLLMSLSCTKIQKKSFAYRHLTFKDFSFLKSG